MISTRVKEKTGKAVFTASAIISLIAVIAIFAFLIIKSVPAFQKIGLFDFVFGSNWLPDRADNYDSKFISGSYGIFSMIVGTFSVTIGALLIGGVFGYFTAVYIAFFCPKALKKVFNAVINLLSGIPSVVYGFFGIVFLLPKLAVFAPNNGSGLLATSIILGIMILPTVVSLSKTSLEAVPSSYYEGALALGATREQAIFKTVVPAARSGINASLILGIGRALGETMAVVMVAGNAPVIPDGLFSSFRVMTANIVMEMGYAGELQEGALVATGVILLMFVLAVNLIFNVVSKKAVVSAVKLKGKRDVKFYPFIFIKSRLSAVSLKVKEFVGVFSQKIKSSRIGAFFAYFCGIASALMLVLVVGFIFYKGVPHLSGELLFGKYKFASKQITIFPAIITTLMAVVISLVIAVPIGVATAVYINEYSNKKSFFIKAVKVAIDVLSGVPSIVYGLFGMITFVNLFGGSSSILAGSMTISIMLLPTIVRSTEESLKSVSDGLREGSFALGAGKMRTIFKIILPSAMPGIVSSIILSMGRVIAESAPFLYTMGSVISSTPNSVFDSGASLAVALYQLSGEGWYMNEAYATAVVLIVLVLGLNLIAEFIAGKLNKKLKGI